MSMQDSFLPKQLKSRTITIFLVLLMVLSLAIGLAGIKKLLPYVPEVDEPSKVQAAAQIASSGDLNPGWFGHPGSTTIYPMVAIFHTWHAVTQNGSFFSPDANLINHFNQNFAQYYFLGRILSISYAVFAIPFIFGIGRKLFNDVVGLSGAFLFMLSPLFWNMAQMARTDSAGVFWGMVALFFCLHTYDNPKWHNFLLSGFLIGVGISSRYFLAALIPVYGLVALLTIWSQRNGRYWQKTLIFSIIGGILILIGFALTTPYFFLDFNTAFAGLTLEARTEHPGADGLSPLGNFWWHITNALPQALTWPIVIFSWCGILLALWQRQIKPLLTLIYIAGFLFGISLSALHWNRWTIPLLPLFALFAAYALHTFIAYLGRRFHSSKRVAVGIYMGALLFISLMPLYNITMYSIRELNEPTRIESREWIVENIPVDSKIALEWYTPPLSDIPYEKEFRFSLAEKPVEAYRAEGFDYLIVSKGVYYRYYAEPDRYAKEIDFYDGLPTRAILVKAFEQQFWQNGPDVHIYQLSE